MATKPTTSVTDKQDSEKQNETKTTTSNQPKTDATHALRHKYSIAEFEPQTFAVEQDNNSSFRHTETPYLHFLHDQRKALSC